MGRGDLSLAGRTAKVKEGGGISVPRAPPRENQGDRAGNAAISGWRRNMKRNDARSAGYILRAMVSRDIQNTLHSTTADRTGTRRSSLNGGFSVSTRMPVIFQVNIKAIRSHKSVRLESVVVSALPAVPPAPAQGL